MRIVGGEFRNRRLKVPRNDGTRPALEMLRGALFDMLEADLPGARVLDLFAGTGALGLEALSRGAKYCLFIENAAPARGIIRTNVEAMNLTGVTRIWRRDAGSLGPAGNMEPFDLVFCDPPYGKGLGEKALASALAGGWIGTGGIAVLEERSGVDLALPESFEEVDRRSYGDTQVVFLRAI